jgi:hypothetical protein
MHGEIRHKANALDPIRFTPSKREFAAFKVDCPIPYGLCPLTGIAHRKTTRTDRQCPYGSPDVRLLSTGQQPVHRGVHIQVIGFPAPRHHHIGTPEEPDQDTAGNLEQGIAVG